MRHLRYNRDVDSYITFSCTTREKTALAERMIRLYGKYNDDVVADELQVEWICRTDGTCRNRCM